MARLRNPGAGMTLELLGVLLEQELPAPHPSLDRQGWRAVMRQRYDLAARYGFDAVDMLCCSRDEKRRRVRGDPLGSAFDGRRTP